MADLECVECPVCGPSQTKVWQDGGKGTRYLRCMTCGTVYASPRSTWGERYAWLTDSFSTTNNVFEMTDHRRFALGKEAEYIQTHVSRGRMLDVGCSVGALFEYFPADQWERHGVELSPSAAAYATKMHGCPVHAGTLASACYSPSSFDLVTVIDTLYYMDDPAAELREIHRIAKPGGFVAIEIPGQGYMLRRNRGLLPYLLDGTWSRVGSDSSYLYWFGPSGLARLLDRCDLEPVGWCVVPSPDRSSTITRWAARCHYEVVNYLSSLSPRALTWAPKYLCVAQVRK